ncbi:hypothetical protein EAX61_04045 [Dokdonia sinensis]|uniref:PorT family protein n=1 Tax=Dokdonia sinensis TaxID=2479847 RepID=A0A3M0GZI4_9FLAO|nr:hypothetical protein [Dokdonia sinensis]RMB62756.1 hypothetical protein EAX61_04045 [Dokdonia sinensis]
MNTIIKIALVATVAFFAQNGMAQDDEQQEKQYQIEYLKDKRERVIENEKETLKNRVAYINAQLAKDIITASEAEALKKEAAESAALNIENETSIIDNQIALVGRNGRISNDFGTQVMIGLGDEDGEGKRVYGVTVNDGKVGKRERKYSRTENNPIVTFGVNTAVVDGEGLGEDFSLSGGYIGLGWDWTTALSRETNFWRVRYGVELQFNKLRLKDNLAFAENGDETITVDFPEKLENAAKFRQTNLVLPLHFEFGGKKKRVYGEGREAHHYHNRPVFGLGGYAGINLSNVQKLEFDVDGDQVKQKTRGDFNTNDFVYGLSAYIGLRGTALYAKYDLSPTFKDNPIEQHNLSLGLRFFLN